MAGNAIAEVFRLIVMTHPPSTKTCRLEYQKFLQSQDAYCLWEQLSCAIKYGCCRPSHDNHFPSVSSSGPPWKVALASSLVDVLLIDYHAIHTRYISLQYCGLLHLYPSSSSPATSPSVLCYHCSTLSSGKLVVVMVVEPSPDQ